jgi:PPP family 3-phenylpropionic acid transporter
VTTGVFAFFRAPLLSLSDATAFEHVRQHGGAYARLRVWGSVGFLAAVLISGKILETHGTAVVLTATTAALGLAAAVSFLLPAPPPEPRPEAVRAWLRLLARSELWLFLGAVALAQAAGAAYDGCFSLHLQRLGFGAPFVGLAWALGVGCEVLLMIWAGPLIRWMGADRMFAISIACAALRWLLLANVHSPTGILLLQPLHGITFGWFYVAGVTLMRDRGGSDAPTAAQGLFAGAFSLGSIPGIAMAGRLLESGGGQRLYSIAAVVAALGAACAMAFRRQGRIIPG